MGTSAWMYVCKLWYEECRLRMVEMRGWYLLARESRAGTDWASLPFFYMFFWLQNCSEQVTFQY